MKKRFVLLFLSLSLLVSAVAPAVSVSALYNDLQPVDKARAYLFTEAFVTCAGKTRRTVSNDNALGSHWFYDGDIKIGHLIDADNGTVRCSDTWWIDQALAMWGVSGNKRGFLCKLTGNNDPNCATSSDDIRANYDPDTVRNAIKDQFYGGANTGIENDEVVKYALYRKTYEIGCKATPQFAFAGANGDQLSSFNSDSDKWRKISVVDDATGNITDWAYKAELGLGKKITVGPTAPEDTKTCIQLVDDTNKRAQAYSDYAKSMVASGKPLTPISGGGDSTPGGGEEVCKLGGIGWIICPVAWFGAKITDEAYEGIKLLLVTQPLSLSDFGDTNPLYSVWKGMRDLANILFIIAFFIIIFSQSTSIGITNYGIKKMLPRIIIAALLINLSYFICAFAVDVSNVIGGGTYGIINGAYEKYRGVGESPDTWTTVTTNVLAGAGIYAGWAAGTAATVGSGAVAGSALLPFLVTALFAVISALVLLIGRQALIIILIIISPLAFAAYILPNTEDLFRKWRKLFITMMAFYAMASLLFAGSKVAAAIIRDNSGGNELLRLASLGVQFFPLFGLPFLIKFSGGLLGRLAGQINDPNRGPFDRLRKKAQGFHNDQKDKARMRTGEYLAKNENWKTKKNGKQVLRKWGDRARYSSYARNKKRDAAYEEHANAAKESEQKFIGSRLAPTEAGTPHDAYFASRMAGMNRKERGQLKQYAEDHQRLQKFIDEGRESSKDALDEEGNIKQGVAPDKRASIVQGRLASEALARSAARVERLGGVNKVMARGQSAVDEIEGRDLKAAQLLQGNLRLDGAGLKAVMTQDIGSTVKGLNGESVIVTEEMRAAAGATLLGQGREVDTVLKAAAQFKDKKLRSFLAQSQVNGNYATLKEKQAASVDEIFQRQHIEGQLENPIAFQTAYDEAASRKIPDLTMQQFAKQEKSSMEATLRNIENGVFSPKQLRTIINNSKAVVSDSNVRQIVPGEDALGAHERIARMTIPTASPPSSDPTSQPTPIPTDPTPVHDVKISRQSESTEIVPSSPKVETSLPVSAAPTTIPKDIQETASRMFETFDAQTIRDIRPSYIDMTISGAGGISKLSNKALANLRKGLEDISAKDEGHQAILNRIIQEQRGRSGGQENHSTNDNNIPPGNYLG